MVGSRLVRFFAVVALAAGVMATNALPAGAITNSCAAPGTIGMFPNGPGGTSQLKTACTLTTATGSVATVYKTEDTPEAVWHLGAARKSAADGHVTSGSATVTSASAHFSTTADVNHGISGPGIPVGSFIRAVVSATSITLSATASATSTTAVLLVENSDARAVSDGHVTSGSTTVTSATAHFCKTGLAGCGSANDVGRSITATDIPHGATVTAVTNNTTATISAAATATSTTEGLTINPPATLTTAREVTDAQRTSGSTTLTSASAAFGASDIGLAVLGSGIPAGDYIAAVTNATTVVLKTAATATATTGQVDIGTANATAPVNGEDALDLGSELDLNPALVTGDDPCSANTAEASNISGKWYNPGSFIAATFGRTTDPSLTQPRIAQIAFPTSVITFAGYVERVRANTAGESQTAAHYDILYPFLPSSLAVCPAPNAVGLSTTFQYHGISLTQGFVASGTGTPGTTFIRELSDFPAGTTTKTTSVYVHIHNSANTVVFNTSAACTETFPNAADFRCGNG